ncbi:MAG: FtsX-like permease family protein [Bacteroidia bacterium]
MAFRIIGAFVLFLACINFMNLSTARSETKEVGIRKTIGSFRSQIIGQFFSESILIVFISWFFALMVTSISLNWFNELADKQIQLPLDNVYFWLISVGFILITGLIAGSYPAFYLSSFQPVKVLKGTLKPGRGASLPRKILVVTQFTVSVTLIIGTIVVYQQINFAKDRPVGYNRDGLVLVQITSPDFEGKYDLLETELKKTGAVIEIAESASPVTGVWSSNGGFEWRGKDPALQAEFATLSVTADYGKTVGWQFVSGRDFLRDYVSDTTGVILTESSAKLMGFENPIGENVRWSPVWRNSMYNFTVIGVVRDMVMLSPYKPVMPTIFFLAENHNWINIKLNPEMNTHEALVKIEGVFKDIIPSVPFDYKFADQEYAMKFEAEERVGKLASVFAILAIFISCLGLSGLASYVAEQRTKEIGIRKVLGASVVNLWQMISRDFVMLVIISWLIAIPVSFYIMNNWLDNYEYQTRISFEVFIFSGLGALVLTLLTVSFQAIKAATANPVKSLRSE